MKFKYETKPSYWHVTLSSGDWSDYREYNYFFHSHDEEELEYIIKEWYDDKCSNAEDAYDCPNLMFESGLFITKRMKEILEKSGESECCYVDDKKVRYERMKVIYAK